MKMGILKWLIFKKYNLKRTFQMGKKHLKFGRESSQEVLFAERKNIQNKEKEIGGNEEFEKEESICLSGSDSGNGDSGKPDYGSEDAVF